MEYIENGTVTTPKGFKASGVEARVKATGRKDVAFIVSDEVADAAGVYTRNLVKGHSLQLTMKHMAGKKLKAVVVNSGIANACAGEAGEAAALEVCKKAATLVNCPEEQVAVGSTGVIGYVLPSDRIVKALDEAFEKLSTDGGHDAERSIMTTDTVPKEIAVKTTIGGKEVTIGGIAKGSGMIHPNMGTMISIITTDANIDADVLDEMLHRIADKTYNRVSVDGDTSVCDMCLCLANGTSGIDRINDANSKEGKEFENAFLAVCENLARRLAKDGEGATKLLEVEVLNAKTKEDAYKVALAVAKSPLCKTAFFGEDANWGRILTAAGYSGANFDPLKADVYIGNLMMCKDGTALAFDEDEALVILKKDEVKVIIDLKDGNCNDRMWTCDFSYDYVKINGSYRT